MTIICSCRVISDRTVKKVLKEKESQGRLVVHRQLYSESLEGKESGKRCPSCVETFQSFADEHNKKVLRNQSKETPALLPDVSVKAL